MFQFAKAGAAKSAQFLPFSAAAAAGSNKKKITNQRPVASVTKAAGADQVTAPKKNDPAKSTKAGGDMDDYMSLAGKMAGGAMFTIGAAVAGGGLLLSGVLGGVLLGAGGLAAVVGAGLYLACR